MSAFAGERAVWSHAFVVALPPAQAFTLFEPEGERRWAEGWDPRYVYPADGRTEAGMVFTTGHGSETTLWTMVRHDPAGGIAEYVRVTPGERIAGVLVQCADAGGGSTRVTVVYTFTGLDAKGNEYVRGWDAARFAAYIDGWGEAIAAALG